MVRKIQMSDFNVISPEDAALFEKLKVFYKDVVELALNGDQVGEHTVVFPYKLGPVLDKVNKDWAKVEE